MHSTPTVKDMVTKLVCTPSMSSTLPEYDQSNLDVVNLLSNWFNDLGFDVGISAIANAPGKYNLLATLGTGDGGLILSGHTDTVPMDEGLWNSDPFTVDEINDRWYGLGTSDMKSFFALVLEAVKPYTERPLRQPLIILATADEESSMSGIRSLQASDIGPAKYAMIGEPTSLRPINQHKGIMMLRADITGLSGHSSNPDQGANAVDASATVIEELIGYRRHLESTFSDDRFRVYHPTLNLGCVHGGKNPNRICDNVSISLDVRVLPGMDNNQVLKELTARLTGLFPGDPRLACSLQLLHDPVAPFTNQRTDLLGALEELTGEAPCSEAFATEAPFLAAMGVETVVMGPGSIDQAHQPNEYIGLNQLEPTVAIIRALIAKYCL